MKIYEIIKKSSVEDMAKIIGATIAVSSMQLTPEQALKVNYKNTVEALQQEMDIDYKQTNADRIRAMSDEELAEFLVNVETHGYYDQSISGTLDMIDWLQSEAEDKK